MEQYPSSSSSRTDRKTIEKNRRNHMKALYSRLNSMIPHEVTRETLSLPDQLQEAVNYIKKLQIDVEKMKRKKDRLIRLVNGESAAATLRLPQIEIHEKGSALEVVLITVADCHFIFSETVRILHEEGVDVLNASFNMLGDTVFHTIHSKVGGDPEEYALRAARVSEKLRKFVYGAS